MALAEQKAALLRQGQEQHKTGQLRAAGTTCRRLLDVDPANADALYLLGKLARQSGRNEQAARLLAKALKTRAGDWELHCELGDALQDCGNFKAAVEEYTRALSITNAPRAFYSLGCAQNALKEYAVAAAAFRQAVEAEPNWYQARHNLGQALFELGQVDDAFHQFQLAADSEQPEMPRAMLAVIVPQVPSATNELVLTTRQAWAASLPAGVAGTRQRAVRLRIGYVSSFFQRDNWMKPVWSLINQHDRDRFTIHLFADCALADIKHGYRHQKEDHLHPISGLANTQVAQLIEESAIDILVDLNGFSKMTRLPLFALRPAPVIVGWFNMFATTGMAAFDYLIADSSVLPADEEKFYSEKILRVPGSYLTFAVDYPVPPVAEVAGGTFTYGCLAPLYKITPEVIAVFSQVLTAVAGSQLILRNSALESAETQNFVLAQFAARGIAAERLSLEGPADHYEFLKTYERIDLALDTFPYNGGTTTTEAIWQGVPVIAFSGDRWVARTSASILRAANLSDFLSDDLDGYISRAIAFGLKGRKNLVSLRRNMRHHLLNSPVCDTATFARNMQELYQQIVLT